MNKTVAIRYGNHSDRDFMIKDALLSLGVTYYTINKTNKGAPEVLELDPFTGHSIRKIWVSISHSTHHSFGIIKKTKAAIVISLEHPVGIDMERENRKIGIRPTRILSKKEMMVYNSSMEYCDPETLNSLMIKFWTMKEAMLKSRGTGINTSLSGCCSIREMQNGKINLFRKDGFIISLYLGEFEPSAE